MNVSQNMTCAELVELVAGSVEGALPAADRARFDAHLAGCPPCGRYLNELRVTITPSGRLRPEAVPDDVAATLLDVFRRWRRSP